jgi:hypothetical protein
VTVELLGSANPRGRAIIHQLDGALGPNRVRTRRGDVMVLMNSPDRARARVRAALEAVAGDWDEYLAVRLRPVAAEPEALERDRVDGDDDARARH